MNISVSRGNKHLLFRDNSSTTERSESCELWNHYEKNKLDILPVAMPTFHPFPKLPMELRIQIWGWAIVNDRVIKIRRVDRGKTSGPFVAAYRDWSPTPVPGVTRICRESRKYSNYQKFIISEESLKYIWVNWKLDILQMPSSVMAEFALSASSLERERFRHLRIELRGEDGPDESESFYYQFSNLFRYFPGMSSQSSHSI